MNATASEWQWFLLCLGYGLLGLILGFLANEGFHLRQETLAMRQSRMQAEALLKKGQMTLGSLTEALRERNGGQG